MGTGLVEWASVCGRYVEGAVYLSLTEVQLKALVVLTDQCS